jgi:hypothetical protein
MKLGHFLHTSFVWAVNNFSQILILFILCGYGGAGGLQGGESCLNIYCEYGCFVFVP